MRRYKAAILVSLAVVVILAAIGYSFYRFQSKHQVDYTLDFGSVLDAVALLLIGGFIEYAYLKASSEKQADTDLLLAIVRDANAAFKALMDETQPCESGCKLTETERIALTRSERELANAIHSIEEAFRHCRIQAEELHFGKVKDARDELKESLTDEPFPGPYDHAS